MSFVRRVAQALPAPVVNVAAHRDLYLPGLPGRDRRPIALVYGNCQAEALRRLLATHPGFAARYQLLRVPAVHEITPRALGLIYKRLPEVEVLISQEVRTDYRGMALGTAQIADRLPPTARVLRYPVAYFDGPFPFHVYVKRDHEPLATGAPISDYHDLRHLYAASRGWDTPTTLRRLDELEVDPSWVRDNAERSLVELATRESDLTAQLTPLIREHPTSSFMTVNHPVNRLLTDVARQLLVALGYGDADVVLASRQTYLDHLRAPLEPQILRALGGADAPDAHNDWVTPERTFSRDEVVSAHLDFYAAEPQLVANGVRAHAGRLRTLEEMWH